MSLHTAADSSGPTPPSPAAALVADAAVEGMLLAAEGMMPCSVCAGLCGRTAKRRGRGRTAGEVSENRRRRANATECAMNVCKQHLLQRTCEKQ